MKRALEQAGIGLPFLDLKRFQISPSDQSYSCGSQGYENGVYNEEYSSYNVQLAMNNGIGTVSGGIEPDNYGWASTASYGALTSLT